jgi:hypothetical protein
MSMQYEKARVARLLACFWRDGLDHRRAPTTHAVATPPREGTKNMGCHKNIRLMSNNGTRCSVCCKTTLPWRSRRFRFTSTGAFGGYSFPAKVPVRPGITIQAISTGRPLLAVRILRLAVLNSVQYSKKPGRILYSIVMSGQPGLSMPLPGNYDLRSLMWAKNRRLRF